MQKIKRLGIIFLSLITLTAYAGEHTQTVILPAPPQAQPPCGYYYNGNEDQSQSSVTFSHNGNYSTESYSTKPKNPYPYYGNACNQNNSYAIGNYPPYPLYPQRPEGHQKRPE